MLSARKKKLTSLRLLNYFLKFPLLSIQVISLIHWQALKLWLKGVKYIPKNENLHLQKDIYYTKNEDTDVTNIVQKDRADIAEQDGARPTHA